MPASSLPTRSISADRAAVAGLAREVERRSGHPGRQRRHDPPFAAAEHPDEFWDEIIDIDLRSQFVLTPESAGNARPRFREDHLHGVSTQLPGRHQRGQLLGGEIGITGMVRALAATGTAIAYRQRHRSGIYRHRRHPTVQVERGGTPDS